MRGRASYFMRYRGFTLFEVLIALFIFAIMGVLAAVGLRSVIRSSYKISALDTHLQQLELAMVLLQRDISQMIDRPIRDASGQLGSALSASDSVITFTRAGYLNLFDAEKRGDMERVSYVVAGGTFTRSVWAALDRTNNTRKTSRVLLQDVDRGSIKYVDERGQLSDWWPPARGTQLKFPKAVVIHFSFKKWGEVQRVIPVASRGFLQKVITVNEAS